MNLPKRIFFTGIPGSGWSIIAQTIEQLKGFNTSDRTPERYYTHISGIRHMGAYFGKGMEFNLDLDANNIDSPWPDSTGTRIIKSHDWALCLNEIKSRYPDDWIMLIYRSELISLDLWLESGGFNIKYPIYSAYQNKDVIFAHMQKCNKSMLEFSMRHKIKWSHFTSQWIHETFGQQIDDFGWNANTLVTVIK